jgi:hypothetical protein
MPIRTAPSLGWQTIHAQTVRELLVNRKPSWIWSSHITVKSWSRPTSMPKQKSCLERLIESKLKDQFVGQELWSIVTCTNGSSSGHLGLTWSKYSPLVIVLRDQLTLQPRQKSLIQSIFQCYAVMGNIIRAAVRGNDLQLPTPGDSWKGKFVQDSHSAFAGLSIEARW